MQHSVSTHRCALAGRATWHALITRRRGGSRLLPSFAPGGALAHMDWCGWCSAVTGCCLPVIAVCAALCLSDAAPGTALTQGFGHVCRMVLLLAAAYGGWRGYCGTQYWGCHLWGHVWRLSAGGYCCQGVSSTRQSPCRLLAATDAAAQLQWPRPQASTARVVRGKLPPCCWLDKCFTACADLLLVGMPCLHGVHTVQLWAGRF